jgi:hypothetical protein
MKKSIATALTSANIAKVLEALSESPSKLEALSKSLTGQQLRKPLGIGERSVTETVAHLINSEARVSESIQLALLIEEPLIANIHSEKEWGKLVRFDLLEFSELLTYFTIRRKVLLRVLSGLQEKDWARTVREEGKQRKESVYWRARTIAMHELEHLEDLERKLSKK